MSGRAPAKKQLIITQSGGGAVETAREKMRFTTSSRTLAERIVMVDKMVAGGKTPMPILNDIVFDIKGNTLSMTAADIENRLTTTVELTEADGEGCFAIGAKDIMEGVKNLPDQPLTFETTDGSTVRVVYQGGYFILPTEDATEFPQLPDLNGETTTTFHIAEGRMQTCIARSLFATAQDELRPVMNGIYFDLTEETLNIVASDGHQLVRNRLLDIRAEEGKTAAFILPKKPAALLKGILSAGKDDLLSVSFDGRQARVTGENFDMVCRLIEGRYPNYNSVIPQNNPNIMIVDRQALTAALKRVKPFANESSNIVRFHVEKDTLQLDAEDYDFSKTASERLACQYDGQVMSIGFKGVSLIELLNNIRSEEIRLELADPSRAALLLPAEQEDGEDMLMLRMPVLIS